MDELEQLKHDRAEARGIVFDLDAELTQTRIERDDLRSALHLVNQANEGHVKLIAKLAAERDGWEDNAADTLRQLERVAMDRDELKRELDKVRDERDDLLWKIPNY